MFRKLYSREGILIALLDAIDKGEKISVFGCGRGEKISIVGETERFILFVASTEKEGREYEKIFQQLKFRCEVLFASPPMDLCKIGKEEEKFVSTLLKALNNDLDILIVTPNVLPIKFPNKEDLLKNDLFLEENEDCDLDYLTSKLIDFGYRRKESLEGVGDFCIRGDIVDIFLFTEDFPVRILLDFDKVSTIKKLNKETFLPVTELNNIHIFSCNFLTIDSMVVKKELKNLQKKLDVKYKEKIEIALSYLEENKLQNSFWFLPFATNFTSSIYDILPEDSMVVFSDVKATFDGLQSSIKEYNANLKNCVEEGLFLPMHLQLKLNEKECCNFVKGHTLLAFQYIVNANKLFSPSKVFNLQTLAQINYCDKEKLLLSDLQNKDKKGYTNIVFVKDKESANRFSSLFNGKLNYKVCSNMVAVQKGIVNLVVKDYSQSFAFVEEKIFVVGTAFLYREVVKETLAKWEEGEYSLPEVGDFVVHRIHGIGKCLGVETLKLSSSARDYIIIEYKNQDRLYLPVENIDSISKYLGNDKKPTLNKIGGVEFSKIKTKVKNSLKEMAFSLVELYKKREVLEGYKYPEDDELQQSFEDSFVFEETPDQLKAISEIKEDMQTGKIMDRLVCGDVGFGKTEVALRAAFKTICAGRKVAFLCPTTILSEQHYNTCLARMSSFGVRIEVLNRFKTSSETARITDQLSKGEVDIVVGTHKLLNSKIYIKNLGLLILDEEQKFGVEDKEKIKTLKSNINVLTLSATPIPRTLHMSMVGIRDISIIETPPVSRIPTIVRVTEFNEHLIKSAIEQEVERDGQVLIVFNKVEKIWDFASKIKRLVNNDISLDVAHGQMEEKELSKVIQRLYNKEIQVLVATTLIENGVDLPWANTLIVINADMLGLSQLYQLKGRIGRSDRQAFAYFMYDNRKILTENAYKRLESINEFTAMGSGFRIALRDMEIRGVGNVFGKEQHGHMQRVGYAMFVSLLNQAVAEVKGEHFAVPSELKIETDLNTFISKELLGNSAQRISLYMAISKIDSKSDYDSIIEKLEDIYGFLPKEIENLCKIAYIKNLGVKIKANKICIKQKNTYIQFERSEDVLSPKIMKIVDKFKDRIVLKLDTLPIINFINIAEEYNKLDFMLEFLYNINN